MKKLLEPIFYLLSKPRTFAGLYVFFVLLFLLQTGVTYGFLRTVSWKQTTAELDQTLARVRNDFQYKDGKWDTSLYNSDPLTAYPNSSSSYPLYIVTVDGFVIERSKPINGLLDTSDFKHLLQFQTPQLITTVTNEHWRVLSKPIVRDGKTHGIVMVSLYNPNEASLETTDKQLVESVNRLESVVTVKDDQLNVEAVDVRNIHYLVSFEIVDNFNKVLINDGRIPSFIDPSYVKKELTPTTERVVSDAQSREEFLISSLPILDDQSNPLGVIVAGRSIHSLNSTLYRYLFIALLFSFILPLPMTVIASQLLLPKQRKDSNHAEETPRALPKHLTFDKKQSLLKVDDEVVEIAYASNQYYLCKAIFSAPKKRWEQDELIEMMGEKTTDKQRTVYDAALAINRKCEFKLISHQDKTYFMNPKLYSSLE